MKYDFLFVGAGITAATMCAKLKEKYKILVLDVRPYIGGNCADLKIGDNYQQLHGPHNFHVPSDELIVWHFLNKYTEWIEYENTVTAEIKHNNEIKRVPFPYSKETERITGVLTQKEIIDLFFRGYSEKMWGSKFDDLPKSIKKRVPKDTKDKSVYFPGHIQAQPKKGFSFMMEKMFNGVDILLNVEPDYWQKVSTERIFYAGRPDLPIGEKLKFRSLKFEWRNEQWDANTTCVNFCHKDNPYTRKCNYGMYYGKSSRIVSYETSYEADDELTPYYPFPDQDTEGIMQKLFTKWPNMTLIGRLGQMKYIDMWQAIKNGLEISEKYL
jgi:UDP-galactopyranose mutase